MTSPKPSSQAARFVPLLVIGIVLNTLGIVLASLGGVRYLLMAVGLALMLTAVVKMLQSHSDGGPSEPTP